MRWAEREWWNGTRELIAVEYTERDNLPQWHWLHLRKEGSQVLAVSQTQNLDTEALWDKLSKTQRPPVVITTGPDFCLSRLLTAEQAGDPGSALLGGNAAGDDFALQAFPADGGRVHAAGIRTDFLSQVSALLGKHQARMIGFVFHPAAWATVMPALFEGWSGNHHKVVAFADTWWFKDGLLATSEDLTGRDYTPHLQDDLAAKAEVDAALLRCWAAAATVWAGSLGDSGWTKMATQAKDFRRFSTLQRVAAAGALVLLTSAVLLFGLQWYGNRRKSALEREYLVGMPVISAIDSMKLQVTSRADLLESLGQSTLRPSGVSRVLDRVGGLVPEEVELTDLVWAPTPDELKKLDQDSTSGYNLILRGAAGDSWPVSKFSKSLEETDWVERVHVHGSEMNFRTGNHEFTFLLRVKDAG
jgi:Tfp pilus assembly protein PilN